MPCTPTPSRASPLSARGARDICSSFLPNKPSTALRNARASTATLAFHVAQPGRLECADTRTHLGGTPGRKRPGPLRPASPAPPAGRARRRPPPRAAAPGASPPLPPQGSGRPFWMGRQRWPQIARHRAQTLCLQPRGCGAWVGMAPAAVKSAGGACKRRGAANSSGSARGRRRRADLWHRWATAHCCDASQSTGPHLWRGTSPAGCWGSARTPGGSTFPGKAAASAGEGVGEGGGALVVGAVPAQPHMQAGQRAIAVRCLHVSATSRGQSRPGL